MCWYLIPCVSLREGEHGACDAASTKRAVLTSWVTQLDGSTVNSVGDDLQQAQAARVGIRIQLPRLAGRSVIRSLTHPLAHPLTSLTLLFVASSVTSLTNSFIFLTH